MKNTELAFCKFSKYPILKSIRVKFSRYKQKSMNVSVSFDTLILIGKSLFLKRLKKYVSSKRGIENRRLLEKIKTFFSKVVVIIEFMKKIVHVQKIAVAHMFNVMSCHAFWRILNVLQSKFLCKFFCVCSIQK